jgi:hypothetical protein
MNLNCCDDETLMSYFKKNLVEQIEAIPWKELYVNIDQNGTFVPEVLAEIGRLTIYKLEITNSPYYNTPQCGQILSYIGVLNGESERKKPLSKLELLYFLTKMRFLCLNTKTISPVSEQSPPFPQMYM